MVVRPSHVASDAALLEEAVAAAGETALEVIKAQRTSSLMEIELKLSDETSVHALAIGPYCPARGETVRVSLSPEFAFADPAPNLSDNSVS